MPDDEILTVDEVAARFNVTAQTVRDGWIASGKLKAGRIGRRYAIPASAVEQMLNDALEDREARDNAVWTDPATGLRRAETSDKPADVWNSANAGGEIKQRTPR
jgi:excisionase family DNA binding protein